MPEVYVTNFNRNFTGVSATAAGVFNVQQRDLDVALVGHPLPGCSAPMTRKAAVEASRQVPAGKPFAIWHVRRNPEMRAAIWARDVLRRPIKIVFTSSAQRYHSMYPRWLISMMDAVIPTTPEAARFVPNVFAVVPHGVDVARFAPSNKRTSDWAALGYGGRVGVAAVGRIRPEKGTDLFVETMIRVLKNHHDVVALVIGKAAREHLNFERGLKARVAGAGLSERILFLGELPPEKLPEVMRAISLLVAMARYEGYGMTPLEAMASGTPFVASDTGYYRVFSGGETTGLVVPGEDVLQAVTKVDALLSDSKCLSAMSLAAAAAAQSKFSVEQEAFGIRKVYEQLWQHA